PCAGRGATSRRPPPACASHGRRCWGACSASPYSTHPPATRWPDRNPPMDSSMAALVQAVQAAERILVITGAGLSADSGMPTYRGLGGLYNGVTEEGIAIEAAISGPML